MLSIDHFAPKETSNIFTKKAIILMGPTACGKTDLAIELTKVLPVEIINVDSAQVYIGMDIGTNKPNKLQLAATKHHLIDICHPNQIYSVAKFCQDVSKLLMEINSRGKIPLLVGGSMLYFYGLCFGLSKLPSADPNLRKNLDLEASEYGWQVMHTKLSKLDPLTASKISINDSQRIQRALEICLLTGKTLDKYLASSTKFLSGWNVKYFAIIHKDRKILHHKIATRFNSMLQLGLIAEVEWLCSKNFDINLPAMRSVGYKQLIAYLQGKISKQLACEQAIVATRQLAKKQYTWLRKWQNLVDLNLLDASLEQLHNLRLILEQIKC